MTSRESELNYLINLDAQILKIRKTYTLLRKMRLKNQKNILILLVIFTFLFSCYIIANDSFVEARWRRIDGEDESTTPSDEATTTQPEEEEDEEDEEEQDGTKDNESKVKTNASKIAIGTLIGIISVFIGKGINAIPPLKKDDKIVLDRVPEGPIQLVSAGVADIWPLPTAPVSINRLKKEYQDKIKQIISISEHDPKQIFEAIESMRKAGYTPNEINKGQIDLRVNLYNNPNIKKEDRKWIEIALGAMQKNGWTLKQLESDDFHPGMLYDEGKDDPKEMGWIPKLKQMKKDFEKMRWSPTQNRALPKNQVEIYRGGHAPGAIGKKQREWYGVRTLDTHGQQWGPDYGSSLFDKGMSKPAADLVVDPWKQQLRQYGFPHPFDSVQCKHCKWYNDRDTYRPTIGKVLNPFNKSLGGRLNQKIHNWFMNEYPCPHCDQPVSMPGLKDYKGLDFGSFGGK
jgi:hypothetical protein